MVIAVADIIAEDRQDLGHALVTVDSLKKEVWQKPVLGQEVMTDSTRVFPDKKVVNHERLTRDEAHVDVVVLKGFLPLFPVAPIPGEPAAEEVPRTEHDSAPGLVDVPADLGAFLGILRHDFFPQIHGLHLTSNCEIRPIHEGPGGVLRYEQVTMAQRLET